MSEENILIPKSRYDKLVARMTQPVKNLTPSPGNRNEDHTGIDPSDADSPNQPRGQSPGKTTPEAPHSPKKSLYNDTTPEKPEKPYSPQKPQKKPQKPQKPQKSDGDRSGRTLEEIMSNHDAFLPPGIALNPETTDSVNPAAVRIKKIKNKRPLTTDNRHKKSSVTSKKPYSKVLKEWISL